MGSMYCLGKWLKGRPMFMSSKRFEFWNDFRRIDSWDDCDHCRPKQTQIMYPLKILSSRLVAMHQCFPHTIRSATIHTSMYMPVINLPIEEIEIEWFNMVSISLAAWIRASALPLGFSFIVLMFFHSLIRKLDNVSKEALKEDWNPFVYFVLVQFNKWIFVFYMWHTVLCVHQFDSDYNVCVCGLVWL